MDKIEVVQGRSNAAVVLDALEQGLDVRLTCKDGHSITVVLGEDQSGNTCFSTYATKYKSGEVGAGAGEQILLLCDITVTDFIRYCEKLSNEEIALIVGSMTLNKQ